MSEQKLERTKMNNSASESTISRYLVVAAGSAGIGIALGEIAKSVFAVKNPDVSLAVNAATSAAMCFIGSYCIEPEGRRKLRPVTRGLLSVAFGLSVLGLNSVSEKNYDDYKKQRESLPFIDSKTVIGTKPITIADQYCSGKARGIVIVIEREGQKQRTMCP